MNKPTPKIYRTTNWPTYNRALINRGNIAIWFDPKTQWYAQPKSQHGRNQTYSDTAIQCCLMIKSIFRLSLRMVTGFVQSLIKLCGLDWTAPDYTTLCRRQKHIDIAISYQKSSNGLHLLEPYRVCRRPLFLRECPDEKVKYTPEIRDRAVQLLIESEKDYPSTWAAITAIAPKIGCTPETLRVWYQKYLDKQNPIKVQQLSDQERIKQLERENKELQRANEILRKAAAFFAQAELDRPHK